MTGKHALVLGASGITGWAIVNELLSDHSDAQQFSRVTALTNRPLSASMAGWPENSKLRSSSGIDLLKGDQRTLEEAFKSKISDVETVSHVFFNGGLFQCHREHLADHLNSVQVLHRQRPTIP